jgi:hypothetical protein
MSPRVMQRTEFSHATNDHGRNARGGVMRISICLAASVAILSASALHAGPQEVRSCKFEVKSRCASGDASVTLENGVVKKFEFSDFYCGQPGNLGYSCTIDSARGDKESKWTDEGGATTIENSDPFNPDAPDNVKITPGKFVSIDFAKAQSAGRCGAGAQLPRALVIPAEKGPCRVWLDRD